MAALKEVLSAIKPKLNLDSVTENSSLMMDLGIDSLSMVLMSLAIETKLGFQFEVSEPFKTVGEVIDYIEKAKA